jgi:hypothetical protein
MELQTFYEGTVYICGIFPSVCGSYGNQWGNPLLTLLHAIKKHISMKSIFSLAVTFPLLSWVNTTHYVVTTACEECSLVFLLICLSQFEVGWKLLNDALIHKGHKITFLRSWKLWMCCHALMLGLV